MQSITIIACLATSSFAGGPASTTASSALTVGRPRDRSDRLITIAGQRQESMLAEWSTDAGKTWHPATIYVGTNIDVWRPCDAGAWNRAAVEGRLPAGEQSCLWNYAFDLAMPVKRAALRFKSLSGKVVLQKRIDLHGAVDVFVVDHRNVSELAGGTLPGPWALYPGTNKKPPVMSLGIKLTKRPVVSGRYPVYEIEEAAAPPLVLRPPLKGWYRIYLGMESYGSVQFYLAREQILYPVPEYHTGPNPSNTRLMQEFYIKSADMTGQAVCLACGGARYWRDVAVRYLRFVPMTADEVAHVREVRELARTKGRPFAGYVEQCTPCNYEPASLTLLTHTRNEMRLNKVRGCTDVYVHVIRAGSKAWYHSDVVERYLPSDDLGPHGPAAKWTAWMTQGDPLAVAIAEARAVGLNVWPDMGMNISYKGALRERTIAEHPEYLCGPSGQFLDYRKPPVRDYVVSIATELLTKYDVDGVHLDFARFASNQAFDEASLVAVVRRIHEARRAAEKTWGHPVLIATRIPSYRYHERNAVIYRGDYPAFVAALRTWARSGWIDRIMACSMGRVPYVGGLSLDRYKAAVAGTKTKLWGDLYGGGAFAGTPRSAWVDVARTWVSQGLDGGFFFYTIDRPTEFEQLNWQLRLIDHPGLSVGPADR
jgi:hypothetical protein